MMDKDIQYFEDKYKELLTFSPTAYKYLPSFFEVAGFPHYEDVVSNTYSFFLNKDNPHNLGSLFLDCLLALIYEKTNVDFFMEEATVIREHYTGKGFIDLLIFDTISNNNRCNNALIIENKIKAGIYNDLNDYFNSIDTTGKKQGILLTLYSVDRIYPNYINITHAEWIRKIESLIGDYWEQANDKYLILMRDFFQNLKNQTNSLMMNENIKFYIKHAKKIDELFTLQREANNFILDQLLKTLQANEVLGWSRLNSGSVAINTPIENLKLYFYYTELFQKNSMKFELFSQKEIKDIFINSEAQGKIESLNIENLKLNWRDTGVWLSMLSIEYPDITDTQKMNFKDYLEKSILPEWTRIIKTCVEIVEKK